MIRVTTRAIDLAILVMQKLILFCARPTTWLSVAFLAALFFATLPASASTQVFDHTYPLQPGGIFSLANVNGSVRVDGWDRNQVEVRAVKTALHNPADLDRVQISVESDGERMAVSTHYPRGSGVEVTVEYHVSVPYHVQLTNVDTVNGDVHVRGVSGTGTLDSINGSVEVLDGDGRFNARTTNGDVRLELKRLPQGDPIQLATVNGSVVLSLPAGADAEINVANRNGDFHSDFPLRTLNAYNPRRFRGQLGSGGGDISMSTVNGGIRLVQGHPTV
ncbi:MAG TPA: DUF4097 family beta strand repeat-containing protein [Candidatus Acidoferrales bacterium]|nr:DUF4097 family beta strand repeat-containing protein [Candidatus Acidoferrales bacterium]